MSNNGSKGFSEAVREGAENVMEKAKELSLTAKEKAEAAKDAVVEKAGEVREYAKENPGKSAVASFGIGAFFGAIVAFLLGRRKK